MKNIKILLLGVFGMVMISIITSLATYYCLRPQTDEDKVREIAVRTMEERYNPVFKSSEDATVYYERFEDEQIVDSFIIAMTKDTFVQIAKELIVRNGACNRIDILKEYLENYAPKYEYKPDEDTMQ